MSARLCACFVTKSKRRVSALLPESCRCALRSPRLFQVCLVRVSWRGWRAEREAGERKQEGKKGAVKKKHNMVLKRSQGVRAHCAVLHGDVATLSHLLQEGPCTLWVAMGAFREG